MTLSYDHQFLVELFRTQPLLASELLRRCLGIRIAGVRAELVSSDFSQLAPTEFRADAMIVMRGADDQPTHAIVLEVQLGRDPRKRRTWPVYLAVAGAELDCPVSLLVFVRDAAMETWCSTPIAIGNGGAITPYVVSLARMPRIVDASDAAANPALSILSAMAHHDADVVRIAWAQIAQLPDDVQRIYLADLWASLPAHVRYQLEQDMDPSYLEISPSVRRWREEGRVEGLEQGRELGLEQGRELGLEQGLEQGRQQERIELVRSVLAARFGELSAEVLSRIESLDERGARALLVRMGQVGSLAELFSEK